MAQIPPSSPIRTYLNGVPVDLPAPGQGEARILHRRNTPEFPAVPAPDAIAIAPTRVVMGGVPQDIPQQPYSPPPHAESPMRLFVGGREVDRSTLPAEPEMDEGHAQYYGDKETWMQWQDAYDARRHGGTDADWQAIERAQKIYMERQRIRVKEQRLLLHPFEAPAMPPAPARKAKG